MNTLQLTVLLTHLRAPPVCEGDSISCSHDMRVKSACATPLLDLESDHRAVECCLGLTAAFRNRKAHKQQRLSLMPTYHMRLHHVLIEHPPCNLNELEVAVAHGSTQGSLLERKRNVHARKEIWRQLDFQQLLEQRRRTSCRHDTITLSKLTQKISQTHMPDKRNRPTRLHV